METWRVYATLLIQSRIFGGTAGIAAVGAMASKSSVVPTETVGMRRFSATIQGDVGVAENVAMAAEFVLVAVQLTAIAEISSASASGRSG